MKTTKIGSELFVVDNSDDDWKVQNYLYQWCDIAHAFDIATGYFEIGALLSLDGKWQQLEKIRLLMGDEVSRRTKKAFEEGLAQITYRLNDSLEDAKAQNDFLEGVPAIVEAIKRGQIETRVYRKKKFHAKAYITHSKFDVVGSSALVGSSNFTYPGLHQNIELNIQIRREVEELQAWFERHWEEAEDVTPDVLRTMERHTYPYSPFEVYAKAMTEYFRSHELSVGEWEKTKSIMYPVLDQYQKEGYQALMEISRRYKGALLCDGVGLGKTFIGLMVIDRLLFERKRVALIVPKATRKDVWEAKIKQYMPRALRQVSTLFIYNHTDLLRGGNFPQYMQEIKEDFDAIVIDEAHHFRNRWSQRSQILFNLAEEKQMFLLTATPINNSLYDLMHLIEYFSRRQANYFAAAPLGIHTLRGHFRRMETALDTLMGANGSGPVEIDPRAAEEILSKDDLFQALVVQRSRAYVKRSLEQAGNGTVSFPQRLDPQVVNYSLAKTYGALLQNLEVAFDKNKPLLSLPMYYPLAYYRGDDASIDALEEGRQKQVVGLIRTLLLKRFESSAVAFEASCEDLLLKLLYFVQLHAPKTAERWQGQHAELVARIQTHLQERGLGLTEDEEEFDDDVIPEEFKKRIVQLSEKEYNVTAIVMETMLDMDQLAAFLDDLADFDPAHDDKLQSFIRLLKTDPILQQHKVIIFTEYVTTARYLAQQLAAAGIEVIDEVDSMTTRSRSDIIHAFSPYYNDRSSAELKEQKLKETRVLIATDVLSEGLNLQDAACIINYDLHWNPVRLMQRIGRVDRRLDPDVETQILTDHPAEAAVRGTVRIWNFLPPVELNRILSLYERVTHKTLRISKTFGIEGRKLLTPEDDYDALREFNQAYEGQTTSIEEMRLTYQALLQTYPDLERRLRQMPWRVFSGKQHPTLAARAVFFCYLLPAKDAETDEWTDEAGFTRWYLYDMTSGEIDEDTARIFALIRSQPETPRRTELPKQTLSEIRQQMDKFVTNSYLKKVQAPMGVEGKLVAWMELS